MLRSIAALLHATFDQKPHFCTRESKQLYTASGVRQCVRVCGLFERSGSIKSGTSHHTCPVALHKMHRTAVNVIARAVVKPLTSASESHVRFYTIGTSGRMGCYMGRGFDYLIKGICIWRDVAA